MTSQRIMDYAVAKGISHREAKRRLGGGGDKSGAGSLAPSRGAPVVGTGRPKGAKK